ncbi:MAG: glycoside hydrolase family 15 protein [Nitrospinaceae bacterium]
MSENADYQPIENYGVIGNLHTVALVGMDGSIDFMCFPHFDSPAIFAALLDHRKGGRFKIAPCLKEVRHKQLYFPDTNVLLTRFLSQEGVAEISDFMPVAEGHTHRIIRRAKTVKGEFHYRMICAPRFDYGRTEHKVEIKSNGVLFLSEGKDRPDLFLRCSLPLKIENGAAVAEFKLQKGKSISFILEEIHAGEESPASSPKYVSESFKNTVNFWRNWISKSTYRGRWRETVNRSGLLLKLLTSKPNGSMVAAPTFGLPEEIGGERNWDYRYTWIRDAAFTIYGFIRLGFTEEAAAFMNWLQSTCGLLNDDGSLQIMYGLDGRRELPESYLHHLEGYRGSSPIRIGNAAYQQLQLDIYGELMDTIYLYDKYGAAASHDLWKHVVHLVNWVCKNWYRKDEGIWEVRGGQREFLYSRLMCWVALDRGIRLAMKRSFPAPMERWQKTRDAIYNEIFAHFWDPKRKAFVQYKGSTNMDASNLLMPLVKFISPKDPKWLSTLKAIEEDLVDDSLVYRYKLRNGTPDGLQGEEGTFCMCSFWYVECISRSGDLRKARFLFEKMLGYANHLGLYSEELGPRGEHLGNFPQAFTHLALISAAYNLDKNLSHGESP